MQVLIFIAGAWVLLAAAVAVALGRALRVPQPVVPDTVPEAWLVTR